MTAQRSWIDDLERHVTGKADRTWATPGALAVDLDDRTVQTPALELVDKKLVELMNTPDGRLIIILPPQEGKSQRTSRRFVQWALKLNPDTRVAIASYEHNVARRWGRVNRDDIRDNPAAFQLHVRSDLSGQSEWQLAGYDGGVFSVGIGGGLTGRPVDLLVIDDPIKDRKQADSADYRQAVWDWWTDVASTRLAPGAPVVLILTRWHEDDLAGRLLAAEDGHLWQVLRIPAQADHDPDQGESDPLGRAPGEFLTSARGRTVAQWEAIKVRAGTRTWTALYQGRPTAAAGTIFKRDWWQTYTQPPWIERPDGARIVHGYDDLLISWDMTFKGTEGTDYVAGQVWMRRGADAYLLDQVHGRMDFVATVRAVKQLAARWPQAVLKLVEDKANGSAVLSMLARSVPGLVPVEPDGGKEARAAAVSPIVEGRNVWLPAPELAPWIGGFIDEAAGFPTAAHDDQVDAMSQALNRLILQPLLAGEELVEHGDLDDEMADFGGYVP